jgi:tetratricopeptide (TPR) repeat protein
MVFSALRSLFNRKPPNSNVVGVLLILTNGVRARLEDVTSRNALGFSDNATFLTLRLMQDENAGDLQTLQQDAEHLVRIDIANPVAWDLLSKVIFYKADSLRQGQFWQDMSTVEQQLLRGLYLLGVKAARKSVQLDPLLGDGWLQATTLECFNSEHDEAEDSYWQAVKLDRGALDLYYWGLQMFQPKWVQGETRNLVKVANLAADGGAVDPWVGMQIHELLLQHGFRDQAHALAEKLAPVFQRIAATSPGDILCLQGLSAALQDVGRLDDALTTIRAAIKLDPKDPRAWAQLGAILMARGDYAEAVKAERSAHDLQAPMTLANNPSADLATSWVADTTHSAFGHYYLGYALMLAGSLDEAEKEMHEAIVTYDLAEAEYGMGEVLARKHSFNDAIAHYKRASDNWGGNEMLMVRLAECYCQSQQFAQAKSEAEAAINMQPDDGYAHIVLAAAIRHTNPPASILNLTMPPF